MNIFKYLTIAALLIGIVCVYLFMRPIWVPMYQKVVGKQTVSDVVSRYESETHNRLEPFFQKAGIQYPPSQVTLLAIKDTKQLELWVTHGNKQVYVRSYPILAASGVLGPKLKEGDKQVPEGIYGLEYLNPNSAFHLSMKLNYPNQFDLKNAQIEGRTEPGTNIFIHGKAVSIGCLAMGDEVIEELFILTTLVGKNSVSVAIAPSDPRKNDILKLASGKPEWVNELYIDLSNYFGKFQHDT
ncbi:hypothetical protein PRUB_a3306 [Pseudoalteromonas rubra]|uniref:L,D-TPase catalytic domain-containing protein n=1 Tax=Pseudoalteromonas rubra TaxID=43658 RepID=A0A8T0C2C9_9GAMM|nr:L,D-transpeptidase family protein [Pseudoalteromonas rubra]KAF7783519.1 hypothetical protein PRUB_a3306 [Pseudoalteromonas rubra]